MKFETSETKQKLINAFTGESQSRNRYIIYAKLAKKEGYNLISEIFLETAENEREHAKLFYSHIPNGFYTPNINYPYFIGDTYENLIASASAERDEWENVYKNASQVAKTEGFDDISRLFNNISEIEKRHSHRFSTLAELIKKETLYKKEEVNQWICTKCGHTHIGKEAPCKCPVCEHEQEFFRLFTEKF
ncbi:rubrerythrin family protein [bacterium]|nr:rubrerythrin family protein [bacterium]